VPNVLYYVSWSLYKEQYHGHQGGVKMLQATMNFLITVGAGADADSQELDELALQLCDELTELDIVSAELARGSKLPEGAKGDPTTVGTILIKIAEVGGIAGLTTLLGSWLSRDERRTLTLQLGENKLEITGISEAEQAKLIQWFQMQTGLRLEA
jgi:hypothetical protein